MALWAHSARGWGEALLGWPQKQKSWLFQERVEDRRRKQALQETGGRWDVAPTQVPAPPLCAASGGIPRGYCQESALKDHMMEEQRPFRILCPEEGQRLPMAFRGW